MSKIKTGLLVVAPYPTYQDYKAGTVCTKDADKYIDLVLHRVLLDSDGNSYARGDIHIAYAIPEPIKTVTAASFRAAFEQHKPDLEVLIEDLQPKAIVIVGSRLVPFMTPFRKLDDALRAAGELTISLHTCPVFATYSPRLLIDKYDEYINVFIKRFADALGYVNDDYEDADKLLTPFKIISSIEELDKVLDYVEQAGIFCMDFETSEREWFRETAYATILGFAFQAGYTYIIPLEHDDSPFWADVSTIWKLLERRVFANPNVKKIAQNLWFEILWLRKYGVKKFKGEWHDTMIMSFLLDEHTPNGLKELTRKYFPAFAGYEASIKGTSYTWGTMPMELLCPYNAVDVDMTFRLWVHFEDMLISDDPQGRLYAMYRSYSMPGLKMLSRVTYYGARIDVPHLEEAMDRARPVIEAKELAMRADDTVKRFEADMRAEADGKRKALLEERLAKAHERHTYVTATMQKYIDELEAIDAGELTTYEGINFNSNPQMQILLYDEKYFGLPLMVDERTGEHKKSTERDWLLEFNNVPFITLYLEYKSLRKMVNTYLNGIYKLLCPRGYIHTDYKINGTRTGRISSKNPNLQNLPWYTRLEDETLNWVLGQIRKIFINLEPDEQGSWVMTQADYSQAELRLIANFAQDKGMIDAYMHKIDIHTITGAEIAGNTLEEELALKETDPKAHKKNRTIGKSGNFSIVFGISPEGYADYVRRTTGQIIDINEAIRHIESVMSLYPNLRKWHETYRSKARKYKYVRTLFGQKRRLPDVDSPVSKLRSAALRHSINTPIQGTAGQWTIFAMTCVDMVTPVNMAQPFNTVHDSVFYYIREQYLKPVCDSINAICEMPPLEVYMHVDTDKLTVPMKLDFEFSTTNWTEMAEKDINSL